MTFAQLLVICSQSSTYFLTYTSIFLSLPIFKFPGVNNISLAYVALENIRRVSYQYNESVLLMKKEFQGITE